MDSKISGDVFFREWQCPIYGRKIDESLFYEIANIGCDLPLSPADKPPCGNEAAHAYCKSCPCYAEWD